MKDSFDLTKVASYCRTTDISPGVLVRVSRAYAPNVWFSRASSLVDSDDFFAISSSVTLVVLSVQRLAVRSRCLLTVFSDKHGAINRGFDVNPTTGFGLLYGLVLVE